MAATHWPYRLDIRLVLVHFICFQCRSNHRHIRAALVAELAARAGAVSELRRARDRAEGKGVPVHELWAGGETGGDWRLHRERPQKRHHRHRGEENRLAHRVACV